MPDVDTNAARRLADDLVQMSGTFTNVLYRQRLRAAGRAMNDLAEEVDRLRAERQDAETLKRQLAKLTDDLRLELMTGWCPWCGGLSPCHCEDDE